MLARITALFFDALVVLSAALVYEIATMIDHQLCLFGNECFFYRYQTFIAALVALLGAWWTVRAIEKQITQIEKQAEETRKRKSIAARASMPLSLSNILDFADDCWDVALSFDQPSVVQKNPRLATSVISNLRLCIEHADEGLQRPIADALHDAQLVRARLQSTIDDLSGRGISTPAESVSELIGARLFDIAQLYHKASKLFKYARRETDKQPNWSYA